MRLEIVTDRGRLGELESAWDALAERRGAPPMARHAWFCAAADCYARGELAVVLCWDGDVLCGIAPFAQSHPGPIRSLVWLGWKTHEPEMLLYDSPAALEAIWQGVLGLGRPVCARRLTGPEEERDILRRASPRAGAFFARSAGNRTAAATLGGDWATTVGTKKSELRRRKALEKEGAVAFHVLAPSPDTLEPAMAELIRIEGLGWKTRERSAIGFKPDVEAFLRDYGRRSAAAGTLRLFFLSLDGVNIAVQLLIEQAGRLWQLKIGYDEQWARFSPGRVLMFDILRWADAQGLEAVEYLGQGGAWQSNWPVAFTDHHTVRFYPPTLTGGAVFAADTAEYLWRKTQPPPGGPPKRAPSPTTAASAG